MTANPWRRWERIRERGRRRYVWLHGVLGWGVSVAILWSVAMAAMRGWDRLFTLLPVSLIGFPVGGYLYGVWTWRILESQYQKATRDETGE